jgi:hypothetical protein
MTDTAIRYVPIPEAAAAMGISIRTLQRRISAGTVRTLADNRRVLVGIEAGGDSASSDRHEPVRATAGTAIELPRGDLMAAMVAATRDTETTLARIDHAVAAMAATRRRGNFAWGTAAVAGLAATLGLGLAWATSGHRDELAARLAATEADLAAARLAAATEAEARRTAESDRDKLAGMVVDATVGWVVAGVNAP